MAVDLLTLRRLAAAATPPPWRIAGIGADNEAFVNALLEAADGLMAAAEQNEMMKAGRRPFSDALAERVIGIQVAEIGRLTALLAKVTRSE